MRERREGDRGEGKIRKKGKLKGEGKKREKKKLRFYRTLSSPRPFTQLEGTSSILQNARDKLC